jgi:hypothetical protein
MCYSSNPVGLQRNPETATATVRVTRTVIGQSTEASTHAHGHSTTNWCRCLVAVWTADLVATSTRSFDLAFLVSPPFSENLSFLSGLCAEGTCDDGDPHFGHLGHFAASGANRRQCWRPSTDITSLPNDRYIRRTAKSISHGTLSPPFRLRLPSSVFAVRRRSALPSPKADHTTPHHITHNPEADRLLTTCCHDRVNYTAVQGAVVSPLTLLDLRSIYLIRSSARQPSRTIFMLYLKNSRQGV